MNRAYLQILAIFAFILSACGGKESVVSPTTTQTMDLCASNNINTAIKSINDLQREFDDISLLASNVTRDQLPELITEMQRVRREAEDQSTPTCLATLKSHQLAHMKTVIDTMIAFVGGADVATLNNGIAQAGQQHNLYTLEMARLMGITLVPATNPSTPLATQSP